MKYLFLLLALALPLEADAQTDSLKPSALSRLRGWGGIGLGGSSFGFLRSGDITVSNGLFAVGLMWFATEKISAPVGAGGGSIREFSDFSDERRLKGVRVGILKTTGSWTNGIYVGLGKLSGKIPDEDACISDILGGVSRCFRPIEKTRAIAVMAEFTQSSRFIGFSLKPFLIYGNSEFWPGLTGQLVVGKLR